MRGLLEKDFQLLIQNRSIPAVVMIMIVFMVAEKNNFFVITYLAMMGCFMALGTISYDDADHGMGFIMTFPITRKIYVMEKYVFSYGISLLLIGMGIVANIVMEVTGYKVMEKGELGVVFLSTVLFVGVMLTLMVPVQLKFGADNGRIVMFAVFVGIFAVVYLIGWIGKQHNIDPDQLAESIMRLGFPVILFLLLIAIAAVTAVSCMISIHIMERKEF